MNGGLKVLNLFRYHWFDLALILSIALGAALFITQPAGMTLLLWLSLGSLFLHQVEEWRFPGYFPGMVNAVMFKSDMPDRYPLNANSGMLINVVLGWSGYLLAALFWKQAIWLAIATILVSVGNIFAHTIIFNIKGKTFYNPGLLTSWLLFVPIVYFFFRLVISEELASPLNWIIGIGLGIALNYFGIYKMILWLADTNTLYVFPRRFLSPKDR
jgi:hypothetical protein